MEELMFSRLLGSTHGVMDAVFLGGMFLIVAFKRESIAIPGMFKLAYLLFALSLVLPAILTPVMSSLGGLSTRGFRAGTASDINWVASIIYGGAAPATFALSIICALGSMFPRNLRVPPPNAAPAKHPLD